MNNLKQRIENHPVIFFIGTLFVGFAAGISAYRAIMEIAELKTISKSSYEECLGKQGAGNSTVEWITKIGGSYKIENGNVREVNLSNTQCTNVEIERIKDFALLQSLNISGCNKVNSIGFSIISNLSNIKYLHLSGTSITDGDLGNIRNLRQLSILDLDNTSISDNGLIHIKDLKQLSMLSLDNTKISNDGIGNIELLRNIANLSLSYTNIDDGSIKSLMKIKSLNSITLNGTSVTSKGKSELKNAIPFIKIDERF